MNLKSVDLMIQNCELISAQKALLEMLTRLGLSSDSGHRFEVTLRLLLVLSELRDSQMIERLVLDLNHQNGLNQNFGGDRANYCLALCSAYRGDLASALNFCNLSLEFALNQKSSINTDQYVLTLAGRIACYARLNQWEEGLSDINCINTIKSACKNVDVLIAFLLNTSDFYSRYGDQKLASKSIEEAKQLIRQQKSLLNHLKFTIIKSEIYERSNNLELAIESLAFADALCDPAEMSFRSFRIVENLNRLRAKISENHDLTFDAKTKMVLEKKLGQVDLGQQYLVQTLLSQLSKFPGQIVTKIEICRLLWDQDYDSKIHDNKIYVTIKRLRNLIEPEPHRPKYIHRARGGYYLAV